MTVSLLDLGLAAHSPGHLQNILYCISNAGTFQTSYSTYDGQVDLDPANVFPNQICAITAVQIFSITVTIIMLVQL